jgi:hypothetical protein
MSILSRLSPRSRWWAQAMIATTTGVLLGGTLLVLAWLASTRSVALLLAALGGLNLGHAGMRLLDRSVQREVWRFGWSVGFAAAWHTQHVASEGGVPVPVLRAMADPEGSPVPEPWDDWRADLHAPEQ